APSGAPEASPPDEEAERTSGWLGLVRSVAPRSAEARAGLLAREIPIARGPARPLGAVAPVQARGLLPVMGIELAERLLVRLVALDRELLRPVVFFARPYPVARVLEDRDAGEVEVALAARMIAAVLHVEDHAARGIHGVPLVHAVDLPVRLHQRQDPLLHRLAAVHRAEDALVVHDVGREELGPGDPVLTDHAGVPEMPERLLDLRDVERTCAHSAAWGVSCGQE